MENVRSHDASYTCCFLNRSSIEVLNGVVRFLLNFKDIIFEVTVIVTSLETRTRPTKQTDAWKQHQQRKTTICLTKTLQTKGRFRINVSWSFGARFSYTKTLFINTAINSNIISIIHSTHAPVWICHFGWETPIDIIVHSKCNSRLFSICRGVSRASTYTQAELRWLYGNEDGDYDDDDNNDNMVMVDSNYGGGGSGGCGGGGSGGDGGGGDGADDGSSSSVMVMMMVVVVSMWWSWWGDSKAYLPPTSPSALWGQ